MHNMKGVKCTVWGKITIIAQIVHKIEGIKEFEMAFYSLYKTKQLDENVPVERRDTTIITSDVCSH